MNKTISGLTIAEHEVMQTTVLLWNSLCGITSDGPSRANDLNELALHIHAIQHAVLSQAAGRQYPMEYRLLGSTVKE